MKATIAIVLGLFIVGCHSGAPLSTADICRLLEEADRDAGHDQAVGLLTGERKLTGIVPRSFWRLFLSSSHAEAKLLVQGDSIGSQLYAIATDPQRSESLRVSAWSYIAAINWLDKPGTLERLLDENRQGRLSAENLYWIVREILPIDEWQDIPPPILQSGIAAWLEKEVRARSYEEIVLSLLDETMKPQHFHMWPGNQYFRHYLNRMTDLDQDEWFKQEGPVAYRFRQKIMETKGYDPTGALYFYLNGVYLYDSEDHQFDALLARLFPDEEDRRGCREMIMHMNGVTKRWEDRLRAWYTANRPYFVYDRGKHRFVVIKSAKEPGKITIPSITFSRSQSPSEPVPPSPP